MTDTQKEVNVLDVIDTHLTAKFDALQASDEQTRNTLVQFAMALNHQNAVIQKLVKELEAQGITVDLTVSAGESEG